MFLRKNERLIIRIGLNTFRSKVTRLINRSVEAMVSEGKGRLFRRKDGKYLIYIPKDLAEDSMFPFKGSESIFVKVSFKLGNSQLLIEKWTAEEPKETTAA